MSTARVAVVRPGSTRVDVDEVELPDPSPKQVLVDLWFSGVCHSQLHEIHDERDTLQLLGHEATGVVAAVGAEVDHVVPGDHVVVTWLARTPEQAGTPPEPVTLRFADGEVTTSAVWTWASSIVVDQRYVVRVDADAPMESGAVLGCAVITGAGAVINTAQVQTGQSVAVWGAGGVGLCAIAAARVRGADPIVAVDLDDAKLAVATAFGATHVVNARHDDPVEAVRRHTDAGEGDIGGVDHAFDCIGLPLTTRQIISAAAGGRLGVSEGGNAVLVGVPTEPVTLVTRELLRGQKRLIGSVGGSCRPERDIPIFLDWYHQGLLDLDALVSARYPLERVDDACTDLEASRITGRAVLQLR